MQIELIGGLVAGLVFIAKLFDYYSTKKQSAELKEIKIKLNAICVLATNTWNIHNQYDEDGRPKWYLPKSKMDGISNKLNLILDEIRRTK